MQRFNYLGPFGSRLPALERNIIRLRSMQMILVLFYAEQLKQKIVDLIQGTDSFRIYMEIGQTERVPKGAKNETRKCLNALTADGAITVEEKAEIIRLIDYRNTVGHEIHELVADLGTDHHIRDSPHHSPNRFVVYNYEAVERLQHYLGLLGKRSVSHHYVGTFRLDDLMFASAERTLLADIKKLRAKIIRQFDERKRIVQEVNEQIKSIYPVTEESYPHHPLNQYDNKRLTKRGQEICYRLFDQGKSAMAVASLMRISLTAARKRQNMWEAAGGSARQVIDVSSIPPRKFYRRYEDE